MLSEHAQVGGELGGELGGAVPMRCAVLGDPIAHSLSPTLHRAAYAELGLDWSYDAVRVPAGGAAAYVAGLAAPWRGLSVTAPLKREALALADTATDRARLVGAANTLVLGEDRRVHADNTDLPGAAAALRERYDGEVCEIVVLGAGATAASTALALCDLGARRVTFVARSAERAAETVSVVGRHPSDPEVVVQPTVGGTLSADVVVSTLPASAQDTSLVARCAGIAVVFEVLYDPWPTPLAAAARDTGRVLVGGLDLLVHQAALQLTLFTGLPAPLARMRAAGAEALAARAG